MSNYIIIKRVWHSYEFKGNFEWLEFCIAVKLSHLKI